MNVTYTMHAGPTIVEISEYLMSRGEVPPNPLLSVAWSAKDENGKIIDVIVVRSVPVVDSLHLVDPRVGLTLFGLAETWLRKSGALQIFMHSANPAIQAKIEKAGAHIHREQWYEWIRGQEN